MRCHIAAFVVLFSFSCSLEILCAESPQLVSIALLTKELESVINLAGKIDKETLLGAPTVRRLLAKRRVDCFRELTCRNEAPTVVLAGFFGLKDLDPALGFPSALSAVLRRHKDTSVELYRPMLEQLAEVEYSATTHDAFSSLMKLARSSERGNLVLIVDCLPQPFLEKWFLTEASPLIVPANEAYVVGRLDELQLADPRLAAKVRARVAEYADIPGFARLAYVIHTADRDSRYEACLADVLEDDSLDDDVVALGVDHAPAIKRILESNPTNIRRERREMLRKLIDRTFP